jgi:hypothetical protein
VLFYFNIAKKFIIMNKIVLTLLFVTVTNLTVVAQDDVRKAAENVSGKMDADNSTMKEGWTRGGAIGINLNHASNNNWYTAPEKYILSISGTGNYKAHYKKGKTLWLNDFLLGLGSVKSPSNFGQFRKNDDRLLFSSMYAKQMNRKNWYYAASMDLSTQVLPSYVYSNTSDSKTKIGGFLTPGVIRSGLGVLYKPNNNFRLYISPLTANIITKLDKQFRNVDLFGVDAGKAVNFGLGALLRADYTAKIAGKVDYKTRFDAFADYLDRPFNKIDCDWLNTITFNATKYIGVSLNVNVRYHEVENREIQYIEMLGVGFNYKF